MTRKLKLFAAFAASLFAVTLLAQRNAFARLNGGSTTVTVTQPDQWCVGGSNQGTGNTATEVCVDYNGNLTPTTTNAQTSATSSLQWKSVETKAINAGGGAVSIGGNLQLAGESDLAVKTTSQLVLTTSAPSKIGAQYMVSILKADGTIVSYEICTATSVTVQGGLGTDSDWVISSTATTANLWKSCGI